MAAVSKFGAKKLRIVHSSQ